ncbi:MBOAT family O-acyltransferase [Anaerotruncus rubiinfantis]|uniref:MBOAT family O-acyltransferase n=1 Tax=Anaerotruncus rubiinfantis TaxID=1720200 RepID=UPI00082D73AD|nr:MBOAT family O-acyltransferase [Anaerotruncus rubiinfantis]
MVFSSILFLFRFLPVAFLAYYLTPKRLKNLTLLIASLVFYSWGEVRYFPIMVSVILVNYLAGLGIERFRERKKLCRSILVVSLVFSLGFLAFFKYTNFLLQNLNGIFGLSIPYLGLTLPLGISFYTFQIMTYTIDVYFGKIETEHNIINFGTFVVLFPQLIAGPIVKFSDISAELKDRTITPKMVQDGIALFILGLGSKVLLANAIGSLWTEVETLGFTAVSTPLAWLGIIAFTLQIYFDFSGYSLMAIGMGKALGFTFPQNFNYPYISRSITEFWRRWHMTLSGWFREYLYFPLGGSRVKPLRSYFNLFVVWFATGLWHGASWNFVLWGLYFFVLISLERLWLKPFLDRHRLFSHVYLLFAVVMGWVLFAITDMGRLGVFVGRLFSFVPGSDWIFYLRNYAVILVLGIVFSMPVLNKIRDKCPRITKWFAIPFLALVFLLSTAYLVDSSYNPFLYFRF